MASSRTEQISELLHAGQLAEALAEVVAWEDWLLRLLWAGLPDLLSPAQRATIEAAAAAVDHDPLAPTATQVRRLVLATEIVRHAEAVARRSVPALRTLVIARDDTRGPCPWDRALDDEARGNQAHVVKCLQTRIRVASAVEEELRSMLGERFRPVFLVRAGDGGPEARAGRRRACAGDAGHDRTRAERDGEPRCSPGDVDIYPGDCGRCYWGHTTVRRRMRMCIDGRNFVCPECCHRDCVVRYPTMHDACLARGWPVWKPLTPVESR
jgi:hypothetical protein